MDKETIRKAFLNSKEYDTIIEPVGLSVFRDMDNWWVTVDDYYYDVCDSESVRTFGVHQCIVDGQEQLCFEEV